MADPSGAPPPPLEPPPPQPNEEWIAARFPGSHELSRRETSPAADGTFRRERILKTHFKYPLIRVVEEIRRDASGADEHLITRTAMVADRLLVVLRENTPASQAAALVASAGLRMLQPVGSESLWIVRLPDGDLDAAKRGADALAAMKDQIAYVEPDYLFFPQATPDDTRFSEQWGLHQSTY
jgi:hypothetical protein